MVSIPAAKAVNTKVALAKEETTVDIAGIESTNYPLSDEKTSDS